MGEEAWARMKTRAEKAEARAAELEDELTLALEREKVPFPAKKEAPR
jgi:hypothetical protein